MFDVVDYLELFFNIVILIGLTVTKFILKLLVRLSIGRRMLSSQKICFRIFDCYIFNTNDMVDILHIYYLQ